jgi:hypothetical protein
MNEERGSTFREIILLLAVAALFCGLAICFYSFFHCIELDYTEEQRDACGTQATIIQFIGFSIILGSVVIIFNGIFNVSKRDTKRN